MKIQIRSGVFETNSSSTHSIAIETRDSIPDNLPKELIFTYNYFGWQFNEYTDPEAKASYLYTLLFEVYRKDPILWEQYLNFIVRTLTEYGVKAKFLGLGITLNIYTVGVNELSDNTGIYVWAEIDGGIDHGDERLKLVESVCTDKNMLMSYLFSDKSLIKTGNDNCYIDEDHCSYISVEYPHTLFDF